MQLFQCTPQEVAGIVAGVEGSLAELLGNDVPITTRSLARVKDWITDNPFSRAEVRPGDKEYVTFLYADPQRSAALPVTSEREDLFLFALQDRAAFSISRQVGGQYGFPNAFIEKEPGVVATSRRWSTVEKLVAKYGDD